MFLLWIPELVQREGIKRSIKVILRTPDNLGYESKRSTICLFIYLSCIYHLFIYHIYANHIYVMEEMHIYNDKYVS